MQIFAWITLLCLIGIANGGLFDGDEETSTKSTTRSKSGSGGSGSTDAAEEKSSKSTTKTKKGGGLLDDGEEEKSSSATKKSKKGGLFDVADDDDKSSKSTTKSKNVDGGQVKSTKTTTTTTTTKVTKHGGSTGGGDTEEKSSKSTTKTKKSGGLLDDGDDENSAKGSKGGSLLDDVDDKPGKKPPGKDGEPGDDDPDHGKPGHQHKGPSGNSEVESEGVSDGGKVDLDYPGCKTRFVRVGPTLSYDPDELIINVGETVLFNWEGVATSGMDQITHTVTESISWDQKCVMKKGGFHSKVLRTGAKFTHKFTAVANVTYHCETGGGACQNCQSGMYAKIIVKASGVACPDKIPPANKLKMGKPDPRAVGQVSNPNTKSFDPLG